MANFRGCHKLAFAIGLFLLAAIPCLAASLPAVTPESKPSGSDPAAGLPELIGDLTFYAIVGTVVLSVIFKLTRFGPATRPSHSAARTKPPPLPTR